MKNIIRKVRKAKQLSRKELAKRTNLSEKTIVAIENNSFVPNIDVALRIAAELNCNGDYLFTNKPK